MRWCLLIASLRHNHLIFVSVVCILDQEIPTSHNFFVHLSRLSLFWCSPFLAFVFLFFWQISLARSLSVLFLCCRLFIVIRYTVDCICRFRLSRLWHLASLKMVDFSLWFAIVRWAAYAIFPKHWSCIIFCCHLLISHCVIICGKLWVLASEVRLEQTGIHVELHLLLHASCMVHNMVLLERLVARMVPFGVL